MAGTDDTRVPAATYGHDAAPPSEAALTRRAEMRNTLVAMIWGAVEAERLGERCLHTVLATEERPADMHHPHGVCFYSGPDAPRVLTEQLAGFEAVDPERALHRERALLLALLVASPLRPYVASSVVIAYNDPVARGWPVLYVNHHAGQFTRHISPLDLDLFASIEVVEDGDARALWCRNDRTIEQGQLDNLRLFLAAGGRLC